MLQVGEKAPNFTLRATGGRSISLSDYRGKRDVVLFFYHQDDDPICTRIACSMRDLQPDFESAGAAILGVSEDSVITHETFARKNRLRYYLLSDEEKVVWNAYTTTREGHAAITSLRMTCVIDRDGVVRKVWPEIDLDTHAAEVLQYITQMEQGEESN